METNNFLAQAMMILKPDGEWCIIEGHIAPSLDTTNSLPTQEEADTKALELETEFNLNEYSRLREAEYSKLNQDEMRFDDEINGTTNWIDAILSIKAQFPKPE